MQNLVPETPAILSSFPERFALTEFDDGAVLLDLVTGSLYRLNTVATFICAARTRGESVCDVERGLAHAFGLTLEAAAADMQAVLEGLEEDAPRSRRNPITFEADDAGFLLRWQGEAILRIDRSGRTLTWEAGGAGAGAAPAPHLQWAAPHILALQHPPVLHASAVEWDGGILAFSGTSGAGKTTLARTFAANGARLVAEDLLILSCEGGMPVALACGEASLRRWVAEKSALLTAGGQRAIDVGDLSDAVRGPTLPLHRILFIECARRSGEAIAVQPIAAADALVLLLENGFGELEQREVWIELLEINRAIVEKVPVGSATVPDGLERLQAAVRGYGVTSAS